MSSSLVSCAWGRRVLRLMTPWLMVASLASLSTALLVNRTIDDEYGDPFNQTLTVEYTSGWQYGPDCTTCELHVPASPAYNYTWHDAQRRANDAPENFTITFPGTAIYVYGIIPNKASFPGPGATSVTNLTFSLDGSSAGAYFAEPLTDGGEPFKFNVLVYAKTGLSAQTHTLVVSLATNSSNRLAWSGFLFDYARYTTDLLETASSSSTPSSVSIQSASSLSLVSPSPTATDNVPTPSHHKPIGAIVGGIIGGLLFAAFLFFAFLWWRHKHTNRVSPSTDEKPYLDSTEPTSSQLPTLPAEQPRQFRPLPAIHSPGNSTIDVYSAESFDTGGLLATAIKARMYQAERHRAVSPGSTSSPGRGTASQDSRLPEDQSLRERMDALQAEVERLRGQNAAVLAEVHSPPAYDGSTT